MLVELECVAEVWFANGFVWFWHLDMLLRHILISNRFFIKNLEQFFLTRALRTIGRYLNSCLELKIWIPVSAKSKDVTGGRASEGNR